MYHAPPKRKELIQRIVVYALMSISVITLVVVLVFVMLGYQFNKIDGRIEQGGLVQFNSQPGGAVVSIDSQNLGTQTPARTTMSSGSHFITMERSGYQTWQKTVDVVPGSVLWLNYARLVPKTLKPSSVAEFSTVSDSNVSPDRKWIAMKDDSSTPVIQMENISGSTVKTTTLDLPAASYTAPSEGQTQSFVIAKWDPSSRYILVKHTYDGDKVEWLVVDIKNSEATKNITTMLGFDASDVTFSNSNSKVLYALSGHDLRKIDIGAVTILGPLVSNVAEFKLYNNSTIIYTTLPDETTHTRTAGYYDDGAGKARTIRSYADDGAAPLHMAFGSYYGDTYVAIAYGDEVEVLTGDLPRSDTGDSSSLHAVTSMTIPGGVVRLSIITNGRFVVAQTTHSYVVYDLELKKMTTTELKGPATDAELHWLDGYTVWSDRDGTLRLSEFDGANEQPIMPVVPGFTVTLSPDGTYLYGVSKASDDKYHLDRVRMILP